MYVIVLWFVNFNIFWYLILKIEYVGVYILMYWKVVKIIVICICVLNSNFWCFLLLVLVIYIGFWCIDFVFMGVVLYDYMVYYYLMMDILSFVIFYVLIDNIVYIVLILLMFKMLLVLINLCFFFFCFIKI